MLRSLDRAGVCVLRTFGSGERAADAVNDVDDDASDAAAAAAAAAATTAAADRRRCR